MRVRFLRDIASFDFGYHIGDVADVEPTLAEAWCASGVAERYDTAPETAMAAGARERAVRVSGKARR
jgi:hypothetical protein